MSKERYTVTQNWWWSKTAQKQPRTFSFLSLYRKYSELDLQDLIRIKLGVNEHKCLSMIPQQTMFCSFQGFSLFEIFFNNKKVLEQIDKMLDDWQASVEMGQSADDS